MKRLGCILICLLLMGTACAETAQTDWQSIAGAQLELFLNGDMDALRGEMTAEMAEALDADTLRQTLETLGEPASVEFFDASEEQGYHIVRFAVGQGGGSYLYRFVLNDSGQLAGWQVTPNADQPEIAAPAGDVYTEEIVLRPGEADETGGILTLPAAEGRFPAVILVQGSGASDRNESAYGIAPFQDLAEGLARRGIASIRYDKYTYAHADRIADPASFTVDDEYTRDARAALELLQADSRIGSVFLLGHSQGGMLMPRILSELGTENFAGGIALAGSPLHLWQIQYAQNLALLEQLPEDQQAEIRQTIDVELAKLDAMPGWSEAELKQNTFFGISAWYQWDEMSVDAAQTARANGVPVLCLQGGADWQVTPENGAEAWQSALPEADIVTLDSLSHLFTEVENPTGTLADYVAGSHVSEEAIDAIAEWILAAN